MGWAEWHIKKLLEGETVQFRPKGNSMSPLIESGQLVTVEPVGDRIIKEGDIVLCKVGGNEYLHLVKSIKARGKVFVISNNSGHINGNISKSRIFGIYKKD